jgi:AcrR family transcriptional regulator
MASPDPRARQKLRTRNALVDAAARLLRDGARPTVAEAAEEAMVSRATAYRYFPTQEALLVEASSIAPAVAVVEGLFDRDVSDDPEKRLLKLLDAFNPVVLREEGAMRMALRAYLDAWFANRSDGREDLPVREGRRMRWIEEALAPAFAQLPPDRRRRLAAALALTMGTEPILIMKDVCRIDDGFEALAVLRWAARALLRAALAEEEGAPQPVS